MPRYRAAVIHCLWGENDAYEPVLRRVAVFDRSDRRSSCTWHLSIRHGGTVLGIAACEHLDRLQELVGKFRAASLQSRDHLDLPFADRRSVVSRLPVEAAFAGIRRFPVLDRADERACGVRVSPRAG